MLPEEYKPHIDRLVALFHPRSWDTVTETAYFGVVRRWSESEFVHVCNIAIQEHEYMPKPKHLKAIHDRIKNKQRQQTGNRGGSGCEKCNDGFVPFTVTKGGYEYDKVAACSCEAGKARQEVSYGKRKMKSYVEIFSEEPPMLKLEGDVSPAFKAATSKKVQQYAKDTPTMQQYQNRKQVEEQTKDESNATEYPSDDDLPF